MAQRLELENAGDRQRRRHQLCRQIASDCLPVAAEQHRGQMTARRMARDDDAFRVPTVELSVSIDPRQRLHHLQRDGVDADSRAQRVVRQDDHRTGVNERRRDEGQIALVERSPPAAVDENEDRRVGAGRREDVERLVGPVAVRNVESTRQTFARKRRRLLPALEDLRMLGDARASAVLGIQPCGVEPGHEAPPKSEQRQQPAF